MGYEVRKRKKRDGSVTWNLYHRLVTADHRKDTYIPKDAYVQHGFHPEMDMEDAKERAKQLNALSVHEKREEKKKVRILASARAQAETKSMHLPPAFLDEFENVHLKDLVQKGPSGAYRYKKTLIHWTKAKQAILALDIPLHDWSYKASSFYEWFRKDQISYEYSRKVIAVLNMWGEYMQRKTGAAFSEIKPPRKADKEMIQDAYLDSGKKSKASEPLTPAELESVKDSLKPEQYRWLYLSVWYGLRPSEIDGVGRANWARIETDPQGVKVLWIYQPKLSGVPREQRYKPIPCIFPEQIKGLEYLDQPLKRPIVPTLQKLIKPGLNTYGGRKGFSDLMLGLGQAIEDISIWMGHRSITTTWAKYKQKQVVRYKKPA